MGSDLRDSLGAYYVTNRVVIDVGLIAGAYVVETVRLVMETGPLTMGVDVVVVLVAVAEASASYSAFISGVIFPVQL